MQHAIQIRHVPDEVHRTLKARAAREGVSLSDYLLHEITHIAGRPSVEELLERIRSRAPVKSFDSVAEIRAIRESRR
jgi:hypothetical protein